MTTLVAFNAMLKDFLGDLHSTFPEVDALGLFTLGFDHLIQITPRKPLEMFMKTLIPHSGLVMARDNALFDQELDLGYSINLSDMWNAEGVTESTRAAMWQYISTLFLLGTTIENMPADMLASVESLAQDCAAKVDRGEMGMNDIMSLMMNSMGGLMGAQQPSQKSLE